MLKYFLILLPVITFAQLTPSSVTVTVSRGSTSEPDQVVFSVSLQTGLDATRDSAVAGLLGSGITAANFSYLTSSQAYDSDTNQSKTMLVWGFSLAVPVSNLKSTAALLTAVQTSIGKAKNGTSMSFSVQGLQASPQLQQSAPCVIANLLSDARSKALQLANSAGMGIGAILAVSTSAPMVGYSAGSGLGGVGLPSGCWLTGKFALGGF